MSAFESHPQPLPMPVRTEDDLKRWRGERAAASASVESMEDERLGLLLRGTVEQLAALDGRLATARLRVERAGAVVTTAEREFAEAAERLQALQPERRAKYALAIKAREEAEKLMRDVYAPSAASIAACLVRLVEIEKEIDAANRERPEGEERIKSPDEFRGYPGIDPHYVEQDEKYYVHPRTGVEVRPFQYLPKVLGFDPAYTTQTQAALIELTARTRKKQVRDAGRAAYTPAPLAHEVRLPGLLHNDPKVWPSRT